MQDFEISYEQALEAWTLMYRHILEKHHPKGGKWLFLHMDQLFTEDGMNRLGEITNAQIDTSLINPGRVRTRSTERVSSQIYSLYEELCGLAGYAIKN